MLKLTCILCLTAASAFAADPAARLPVPAAAELQAANKRIAEGHKAAYDQAKTPAQKLAHARTLLEEGTAAGEDPAGQFALLRVAKDIAVQQGDLALALEAINQMAGIFQVDAMQLKVDAAVTVLQPERPAPLAIEILVAVTPLMGETIREERYDLAKTLATAALDAARNAHDPEQIKRFTAWKKDAEEIARKYPQVRQALGVLETKPTDPAANSVVGWYRCSVQGDFDRGLLMLALGEDGRFNALAQKQISDKKPTPLELADAWWKISESLEGKSKSITQNYAVDFYRLAAPELTGTAKTRVLARLKEFSLPAPIPPLSQSTGIRMLGKEIVRTAKLTASRATRPGQFTAVATPSAIWLRSQGNEMILTAPERFLGTVAVLPDDFESISVIRVRGRIIEPSKTNFRIWVGTTNFTLNWEQKNENVVFGEKEPLCKSGPHAMQPGRNHDIEIGEDSGRVRLTVDGAMVFDFEGSLNGKVGFNTFDSAIAVESLEIVGTRK